MKLRKLILLFPFLLLLFSGRDLCAQADTLNTALTENLRKYDPMKATMLAAAFPGLGQIYNRKIWKVPFVYAGFGAVGYSIIYNTTTHTKYLDAYRDVSDNIAETNSYTNIGFIVAPEEFDKALGDDSFNAQTEAWVKDQLINGVDYFRRYRDLSYVGVALWYLITILDANVDAHLADYDVSEDLSIAIRPMPIPTMYGSTIGVGVNITF